MYDYKTSNKYVSPYGSQRLKERITTRMLEKQEGDSFASKTKKTAKKAGKIALAAAAVAGGAAAIYKNKGKIVSFLKKIPQYCSSYKSTAKSAGSIIDLPPSSYKVIN